MNRHEHDKQQRKKSDRAERHTDRRMDGCLLKQQTDGKISFSFVLGKMSMSINEILGIERTKSQLQ